MSLFRAIPFRFEMEGVSFRLYSLSCRRRSGNQAAALQRSLGDLPLTYVASNQHPAGSTESN